MKVKTRKIAIISLSIMLIGFIATLFLEKGTVILLLQSGFEAGLVGGLADWFAVTALFRHPLGIPIPHTALLPSNRERITQALVSTVENDLLNKDSIINKLHQFDVVRKLLNIIERKIRSEEIKSGIPHIIKSIISTISPEQAAVFIKSLLSNFLNQFDSEKLLEVVTVECFKNNYDKELLDIIVVKLEELVKKEEIQKEIGSTAVKALKKMQIKGIMHYTVNTVAGMIGEAKISSLIQDFIITILKELRNPANSSRKMALAGIRDSIKDISNNESIIQKLNEYKGSLTNNDGVNDFIIRTISELQREILRYLSDDSYIEEKILPFIENMIRQISADDELINRLELYIQDQISEYIDHNHEKIGKLVQENLDKYDNKTLVNLIEDKVDNDLQWIRVNGAICGFLIGLILGIIKLFGLV